MPYFVLIKWVLSQVLPNVPVIVRDQSSRILCNDFQVSALKSSHDWWAVAQNVKFSQLVLFAFFSSFFLSSSTNEKIV